MWGATFVMVKEVVSRITALILATGPVFAALFGYLLLQERLGWRGLLGCALILAGMTIGKIGVFNKKLLSSKRE